MGTRIYSVSILVEVDDEATLLSAAQERAIKDGLDPEEAKDLDVSDCLIWLIDPGQSPPGTSILESTVDATKFA